MDYPRDIIQRLAAYMPGEQPETTDVVKLNTNENPYPPADAVMEAIRTLPAEALRRYPSPAANGFRRTAAGVHGVTPEQIIATNGGDELLRLAITVFCEPVGGHANAPGGLGFASPTYSLYEVLAAIHDTPVVHVPLAEDFSLSDDFADRLNDAGCRLAMLVNPHAPTGLLRPLEQIERIARAFNGVLLVDEAYVDFAAHDALSLVQQREDIDNVLILRSLSKGYSLAGLRFGYGIGHEKLIAALQKARDSYNIDAVAQTAATAAVTHRDAAMQTWQRVTDERVRVSDALQQRGWDVLPSQTNFVLATPPAETCASQRDATAAATLYQTLKQQRIFVRYFDQDRLRDKLRITIGTPQQNNALLAALDRIARDAAQQNASSGSDKESS